MNTATYARYSSDNQRESSIEDQQRNCRQWAQRHGLAVSHCYADRAISGARHDRPDYQRLLSDAEAGRFQLLLVDDLSRLSRKNTEMLRTLERLKYIGVRVVGVSDGYDSAQKGHKLQSGLRGMINEIYLDDLAEKTHRGLTGKALQQKSAGGRSYGYRSQAIEDPSRRDEYGRPVVIASNKVIDPGQAKVVRQIFTWYAEGRSPVWIAHELNSQDIPGPRGPWSRSTIYGDKRGGIGILNNPIYIGRYIWNRSKWVKDPETGRRRRLERPPSEWIINELPELRIIDQALWQRVQARLNARRQDTIARALTGKRSGGGRQPKYLLSGLLRCGECGGNYVMVNKVSYGCLQHKDCGETVCDNAIQVRRDLVEARLLEGIKADLLSDEALDYMRREVTRLIAEHKKADKPAKTGKQLQEVEQEIANLVDAIRAGGAKTSPALLDALTKAENERETLLQNRVRTRPANEIPDIIPNLKQAYTRQVERLEQTLKTDVPAARQALIQLLGEAIPLHPNKEAGYLTAEIGLNAEGLLAAGGNAGHKIMVVAGACFGHYLVNLI